jgi:hypothetical protein
MKGAVRSPNDSVGWRCDVMQAFGMGVDKPDVRCAIRLRVRRPCTSERIVAATCAASWCTFACRKSACCHAAGWCTGMRRARSQTSTRVAVALARRATSAPGLGRPPATSAPGRSSCLPHLHRDWTTRAARSLARARRWLQPQPQRMALVTAASISPQRRAYPMLPPEACDHSAASA